MPDNPTTYLQTCSMRPGDVVNVGGMILSRYPEIGMTVNPDRSTYPPFQAKQIPEGNVLVTLVIPREGVCMRAFYGEFSKALNQELTVAIQGERER